MKSKLCLSLALLTIFAAHLAMGQTGPFTISSASSPCATIGLAPNTTTVGIDVEGTFVLTLQPQLSIQGRPASNSTATPTTTNTAQPTITSTGYYQANVAGMSQFQLCPAAYTSGTATVYLSPGFGETGMGSGGAGTTTVTGTVAVNNNSSTGVGQSVSFSAQSALTTAVNVKGSAGNLFALTVTNNAAGVCFLEFMNVASAPTLGTGATMSVPVPAGGSVTFTMGTYAYENFATGISVGMATTYNGSTACATAASATIFYK